MKIRLNLQSRIAKIYPLQDLIKDERVDLNTSDTGLLTDVSEPVYMDQQ